MKSTDFEDGIFFFNGTDKIGPNKLGLFMKEAKTLPGLKANIFLPSGVNGQSGRRAGAAQSAINLSASVRKDKNFLYPTI